MKRIQSELLRIGTRIAREEPVIIAEHLASQMVVSWANDADFQPGLRVEAIFRQRYDFDPKKVASVLFELKYPELGVTSMRVWPDATDAEAYEGPYAELFLDAFTQYDQRPNQLTPVGMSGLGSAITVVPARDLLVA